MRDLHDIGLQRRHVGESKAAPEGCNRDGCNREAVRQMVLGGLGIARFSDFMIADDLRAGRLIELFPGQLDADPLDISALYLTRVSGLRRLGVFLDWLGPISEG
ncbi:LysR substrate-binding domain-containing protein [Roseovarius aestuarii]|nr:LysR substrate-binding domain-containing protein [Roseovarius aestuarii]